jgi:hypothetical protein
LAEYDDYLRLESQLNLSTKGGLERSGEISQGLQVFPGSRGVGVGSLVESWVALQL